ncbi:MAG: GrpB family protein [Bacillota bacterium]
MIVGDVITTIEHIGSTCIIELPAKPIIDIDIVIDSMECFTNVKHKLAQLGYVLEKDLRIVS